MSARDSLERETRDSRVPDVPRDAIEAESPVENPQSKVLGDSDLRCSASADYRQRVDGNGESRRFEAPRTELARFDPRRAGLPATSIDSAAEYVARHREARPWLAMTDAASPEARRIIAAMDAAGGHAHIRHEGWVTEEGNRRRVAWHEDPAQLDPQKRFLGIDGLRQDDAPHRCRTTATRITDPDAFAAAFACGVEHPQVREALNMAFDSKKSPREVTIPIADLLGPGGYRYCTGWRLEPIGGSMKAALGNRETCIATRSEGTAPESPEPRATPVPSFKGGEIVFAFARNNNEQRYEVVTMFPRPVPTAADRRPSDPDKEQRDGTVLLGTTPRQAVRDAHRSRDNLPRSGKLRPRLPAEPRKARR